MLFPPSAKQIAKFSVNPPQGRVRALDITRGFAMLFVCLSHFAEVYFWRNRLSTDLIFRVTKFASPTFILVSGILLGYFYVTRRSSFAKIRENFIMRGLFLLSIGRLIILMAHIPHAGGLDQALHWGFITDTIGLFLIVGPCFVEHLGRVGRVIVATCLIVGSWTALATVSPSNAWLKWIVEMLIGPTGHSTRWYADNFPVLPWLGLYLLGTVVGESLFLRKKHASNWSRNLALVGGMGLVSSMVLYIVTGTAFVQASIASTLHHSGHYLLSPFSKLPPSPGFLIFYGSIGLLILAGFLWIEHSGIGGWYVRNLEIIGRNSLFVFVLQYFVYFTLLHEFHPGYTVLWPLIFLLSLLIIWVGAMVWDKRGWNRYLRLPIFSRG